MHSCVYSVYFIQVERNKINSKIADLLLTRACIVALFTSESLITQSGSIIACFKVSKRKTKDSTLVWQIVAKQCGICDVFFKIFNVLYFYNKTAWLYRKKQDSYMDTLHIITYTSGSLKSQ